MVVAAADALGYSPNLQAQAVANRFSHVGLVLDEQHAHPPMLRAWAYRRRIENRIRAGNTTLPSMAAWPPGNQHERSRVGAG